MCACKLGQGYLLIYLLRHYLGGTYLVSNKHLGSVRTSTYAELAGDNIANDVTLNLSTA